MAALTIKLLLMSVISVCRCNNNSFECNKQVINLSELDKEILKGLRNYTTCDIPKVLEDTRYCGAELDDLASLCEHKKEAALELYGLLGLSGVPKFTMLNITQEVLVSQHNWDQNDADELLNHMSRANYAFERYLECLNTTVSTEAASPEY